MFEERLWKMPSLLQVSNVASYVWQCWEGRVECDISDMSQSASAARNKSPESQGAQIIHGVIAH